MRRFLTLILAVMLAGCTAAAPEQTETASTGKKGCDAFAECETASDAQNGNSFRERYEALNGTENSSGKIHRTITIAEDHPFAETTTADVLKRLENNESFYLYVGDPKCPWCRAVIETAITTAREYGISEILYLEVWDEEGNEILRDKYEVQNGKAVLVKEGAEGYSDLLKAFDSLLDDYTLEDGDNMIEVGEKRIYAPNFFRIEQGKAVKMTTAIPDDMEDPRAEVTQDQLDFMKECFEDLFKAD